MDRIARWYPAFFLNNMLGALLTRLTISHQKNVRVQMLVYMTLGSVQLLMNILAWTIQQTAADATNWVRTCGKTRLDVEQKRRLLTDDSKIRAVTFECKQFAESWAILSVLAANLIYVFTMNCPFISDWGTNGDGYSGRSLLDLVTHTTAFENATDSDKLEPIALKDEVYQDPFEWSEGHMVAMAFFQLAVELPVDILSTRALELLRQPVFSALRPHLGNSRVMYAFQVCISLAMMSVIVNFKYEVVVGKLLHDVDCSDEKVRRDCQSTQAERMAVGLTGNVPNKLTRNRLSETGSASFDPLDVCCFHTVLHPCNLTEQGETSSCWIDSKDSSLVQDALGPMNGAGGENDVLLRLFRLLEALCFAWGTVIAGILFIPRSSQSADDNGSEEFDSKIRKAVDAGIKTRNAEDFLAALELHDYVYQLENEFSITRVTDFWQVDPAEANMERLKVDMALKELLEMESKDRDSMVKLSELVMRNRQRGITKDDIKMMLMKFSTSHWNDDDVDLWLSRIRSDQGLHGDRVLPDDFDEWIEALDQTSPSDAKILSVIENLKMFSKQNMRTYVIEVTTSSVDTVAGTSPQVHVEFFGEYDPSLSVAAKGISSSFVPQHFGTRYSGANLLDGRYIVGDRVYTRSSGDLDLAAYHKVPLPGTHRKLHQEQFEPGSMVAFEVRMPDVGEITAARVWLANGGVPMCWRCETIGITCTQTMVKRVFQTNQHSSKGEIFTRKNTGKVLSVQLPQPPSSEVDSPHRRVTSQKFASDSQLHRALSLLEQRPHESGRHRAMTLPSRPSGAHSDEDMSMPQDATHPSSSSPGSPERGIWSHLLSADSTKQLPSEDLMFVCEVHNKDVQDNLDIVAEGQDPPISLSELKKVVEKCTDDSGQVTVQTFTNAVRNNMERSGCSRHSIAEYFETRAVIPAWHEEAWLHDTANFIYTVTLHTSRKHAVRNLVVSFFMRLSRLIFLVDYCVLHRPHSKAESTCSYWV